MVFVIAQYNAPGSSPQKKVEIKYEKVGEEKMKCQETKSKDANQRNEWPAEKMNRSIMSAI